MHAKNGFIFFCFLILKISNFKFGHCDKNKKSKTLFDSVFNAESENVIFKAVG